MLLQTHLCYVISEGIINDTCSIRNFTCSITVLKYIKIINIFTLAVLLLFYALTDSVTADSIIYDKCSNRTENQFQC